MSLVADAVQDCALQEHALRVSEPEPPIDLAHLHHMTLGDPAVEREVLKLFDRQITMQLARMAGASPELVAASAHTLKGSAAGLGALPLFKAAEAVEAAAKASPEALDTAVRSLATTAAVARREIADILNCT
jgi:hypothetical protein